MSQGASALLVTASAEHARMLQGALAALDGWDWVRVGDRAEASALLDLRAFSVVLVDTDGAAWDLGEIARLKARLGRCPLLLLGRPPASAGRSGVWVDWDRFSYAKFAAALAALGRVEGVLDAPKTAWDTLTGLSRAGVTVEQAGKVCEEQLKRHGSAAALILRFDGETGIPENWFRQVVARVRACLSEGDLLGLVGEAELGLLLPGVGTPGETAARGRRILESLRGLSAALPGAPRPSLGAAFLSSNLHSAAALYEAARGGAARSSALGGDCLHFDETRFDEEAGLDFRYEVDLRLGLALGQFDLHWQPQASLDGRVNRAEALLRWQHPQRGAVPPREFVAFAESHGLMEPLFDWSIRRILACRTSLEASRPGFRVTVNLSVRQLQAPGMADTVLECLERGGCPGRGLSVDVTESESMENLGELCGVLEKLRARGVETVLDDFGGLTVPSGLLTRLPLDAVKLDPTLIENLERHGDDERIAESIVSLAHQRGLVVVAEGVERASQVEVLRRIGCDEFQGDLLARPQAFDGFAHWLQKMPHKRVP